MREGGKAIKGVCVCVCVWFGWGGGDVWGGQMVKEAVVKRDTLKDSTALNVFTKEEKKKRKHK